MDTGITFNKILTLSFFFLFFLANAQHKTEMVSDFEKIVIGPYIKADLVQGSKQSIKVISNNISKDMLVINVNNKTLDIYVKGAKSSYNEKIERSVNGEVNIKIEITYKELEDLTIKGNEKVNFKSDLISSNFNFKGEGNGSLLLKSINVKDLKGQLYGNFTISALEGEVDNQSFKIYGNAEIAFSDVVSKRAKLTMYGNNKVYLNVTDYFKTSGFGNYQVRYKGNPEIKKGISIGKGVVEKIK